MSGRHLLLLVALAAGACSSAPAPALDFSSVELGGVDAGADAAPRVYQGPLFRRRAEAGELALFERDEVVVNGSGELELRPGGGHPEQDPFAAGSYHGGNYHNGGSYRVGTARSLPWVSAELFDSVVPSFEVQTPPATWVAIALSVRVGGVWSREYAMGVWASSRSTVARHSVDGQDDAVAAVQVDTLSLKQKAEAVRFVVRLYSTDATTPRVRSLAAIVADRGSEPRPDTSTPAALGKLLEVPKRSQMVYPETDGWCSPTSTSMVLGYWSGKLGRPALLESVPAAADGIFDFVYDGTGNWPFNTAHAASLDGGALHAVVTRLSSLHQAERLIAAGIPLVISISFAAGELTGGPVTATDGHLIVLRGFTPSGDVVCNDPAFPSDAAVQVTYQRSEIEKVWSHSQRTAYLIWPVAGPLPPVDPLGAF